MKVLIACEESQEVCKAFRERGHEAYSCDIQECSGGHPEWHLQQDVTQLLNQEWDLIIAFPPCTYLTKAGNSMYSTKRCTPAEIEARKKKREEAVAFFLAIANAPCSKIAIENPIGYMNSHYKKPSQIIQPYYFGDNEEKATCLWLKGLPNLEATKLLPRPEAKRISKSGKRITFAESVPGTGGQLNRAKVRSKTFPGVAAAMAAQWG